MNTRITVVFAVNDAYAQHLCTAIVSVLENNSGYDFDFYVLTDYFSDANRELLCRTIARYGSGHHFGIVPVDGEQFGALKLNIAHITSHTYYRFLIPELLPDAERVLYLDADLVVDGDLGELWATSLDGVLCAGVKDLYIEQQRYKCRIGFGDNDLYVNAGVLLLNLGAMRREGTSARLMETAANRGGEFEYQDQDVLNVVLRGRIREVPAKWNYAAENVVTAPIAGPVIVHYTGRAKPWTIWEKSRNPLRGLYFRYLRKTPYGRKFLLRFRWGRFCRLLHKWGLPVRKSDF